MKTSVFVLAASIVVTTVATAFAAWEPVETSRTTETIYVAETAGRSGNVKACYETQVTYITYTWTHTQTERTRGTYTETETGTQTEVPVSNCSG